MTKKQGELVTCQICKKQKRASEVVPAEVVPDPVVEMIKKGRPDWSSSGFICLADYNLFRAEYVQYVIETERDELSDLETNVTKNLSEQELLLKDVNAEFDRKLTLGERLADKVASFGGSWRFIFIFAGVMTLWIVLNSILLMRRPFDPFPFILLNLCLSCLAAIQAPVIMMSQNRMEARDRLRAEHDYRVNLKAELGIRLLHAKIDQLLTHQWQRLMEVQKIQTDLMEEIIQKR